MKPEADERLSTLNCSPFINTLLIQEICHNFRGVRMNDVERDATMNICRGEGVIGCLSPSFGGK